MANTKEIKANWAERLRKVNETQSLPPNIQMRLDPAEVRQVLDEGVPEDLEEFNKHVRAAKKPTHILVWRDQLQMMIDYDPRNKPARDTAIVPGQ